VGQILFVTGTDTDAGKTLLAASLLHHLRARGVAALGMKPFCSGGTADVDLLLALQGPGLTRAEANPFYFREPLAPLVAARRARRRIPLADVLAVIRQAAARCDVLLVEGSGGLLAPLGENSPKRLLPEVPGPRSGASDSDPAPRCPPNHAGLETGAPVQGEDYDARDILARLECPALVTARNRLGVINHSLLTAQSLRAAGVRQIAFVLMDTARPDPSAGSNPAVLRELLAPAPVLRLPFLGARASTARAVMRNAGRIAGTMRRLWRAVR
jgi:dethiobiotin synthetase